MRAAILLCLLLAMPGRAFAQSGSEYDEAVAARLAGDYERAATLLQPIVSADPADADAQLQLGLALLALDRLDEAERAFHTVLAVAPAYADARVGLARIAQRRGDRAGALAELDRVDPAYPDAAALRKQLAKRPAAGRSWRLDLDGSRSAVQGGQSDWWGLSAQLGHELSPTTAVAGRIEAARRFGRSDVYGEVRIDRQFSDRVRAYASFGATAEADFLPEWQLSLGGSARISDGGNATVLTLDARRAQYVSGGVHTVTPGIEQYLGGGRIWLTGRWINIFEDGDNRSGYLAQIDGMATDSLRLFAGVSDAPDTSEGVVVETQALFAGAVLDIGERARVRLSIVHEDRETGLDRTQFSLGFGQEF